MEKEQSLHKELDLIQNVITRMSNNSFLVKGWTITLISALIVFGKEAILLNTKGIYYLLLLIVIIIPFWWLDAFFLRQEKLFRKIYQRAIADPDAANRLRYSLNPHEAKTEVKAVWHTMFSNHLVWFYVPVIFLVGLIILLKAFAVF